MTLIMPMALNGFIIKSSIKNYLEKGLNNFAREPIREKVPRQRARFPFLNKPCCKNTF